MLSVILILVAALTVILVLAIPATIHKDVRNRIKDNPQYNGRLEMSFIRLWYGAAALMLAFAAVYVWTAVTESPAIPSLNGAAFVKFCAQVAFLVYIAFMASSLFILQYSPSKERAVALLGITVLIIVLGWGVGLTKESAGPLKLIFETLAIGGFVTICFQYAKAPAYVPPEKADGPQQNYPENNRP